MSERGFKGRYRSAIIAVLVTRGSATIKVLEGLASRYWQRIGWLSAMFAPMRKMTSAWLRSSYAPGVPSLPKERLYSETALATHSVVFPSYLFVPHHSFTTLQSA